MRFKYPRNEKGELVAYDGDTEKAYQQAAAALILWPLEREDLVDDPIKFIERFEGKEAPTGPIMFQGDPGPVAFRNIRILT